jgi:hypothetical protein
VKHSDTQFNVQHEPSTASFGTKILTRAARSKSSSKVRSKKPVGKKTARPAGQPSRKNRSTSKQDRVLALLRRPDGATLDVLIKVTGWQQHSIRGFLAGTVRKKLKLPLHSEKVRGVRVYRLAAGTHEPRQTARADGARSV